MNTKTVSLKTLNEGDKFKFRYQLAADEVFVVERKPESKKEQVTVSQVEPNDWHSGNYHPDTAVYRL